MQGPEQKRSFVFSHDRREVEAKMLICVTNRKLCQDDFLLRLDRITAQHPCAVILREKDLPEDAYEELAEKCLAICNSHGVPMQVHTWINVAKRIGCDGIHLPFRTFMEYAENASDVFSGFTRIGVSLHSAEEASALRGTPATYIQAGHVFATDCKRDLPPRGLPFLKEVCQATELPVFAIGGITPERYPAVMEAGAAGACVMSGLMNCMDAEGYMAKFSDS